MRKIVLFSSSVLLAGIFFAPTQAMAAHASPFFNITINEQTTAGDANFGLHIDVVNGVLGESTDDFSIQTASSTGSYLFSGVVANGDLYYLTQNTLVGWQAPSVDCSSDNSAVTFATTTGGVIIAAQSYSSVTCDFTNTPIPPSPVRIPVIVVPGTIGSYMVRDDGGAEVWPDVNDMVTQKDDKYLDDLALDSNGDKVVSISQGTVIRSVSIAKFGVEDLLQGLFNELDSSGFTENTDLFEFPYDWRLDITQTASDNDISDGVASLKEKIDAVEKQTGATKVDLVAHSMGGLLVKKYLKDYGGSSVDTFIDIATPHNGAPEAFKILNYGDNLGFKAFGLMLLNEGEMKKISQNMPAVYELLPSEKYFDSENNNYKSYVFNGINTNQNLTFQQTEDYLDGQGRNSTMVANADAFHQQIDGLDPSTYGVKTYNIIGCGTPTIGQFFILDQKKDGTYDYDIKMINGDGTVPLESAQAMNAIDTYYVKGGVHATLPSTSGVPEIVADILNGSTTDTTAYQNILTSATNCRIPNGKIVSFHSPITLNVYDASGNHAGPDANGDIEDNIPGADYETIEDNKFIFLPDGQDYKITGQATDAGTFDARIEDIVNEEVATTTIFHDVPINLNSQTEFEVGSTTPTSIALDEDGDGTFESTADVSSISAGFVETDDQAPSQIISVTSTSTATTTLVSASGPSSAETFSTVAFHSSGSAHAAVRPIQLAIATPVQSTLIIQPMPVKPVVNVIQVVPKIKTKLVATNPKITLNHQVNTAVAYQALKPSLKNVFKSWWGWIKKRL